MLSDAIQTVVKILAIEFTLEGFTFSILELILYFAFGSLLTFIIGGILE